MSVLLTRIKPQLEDTKYLHTNHSYSITRRRMLDPNIAREILKLLDFDGSGTVKTSDLHEAFMGTGLSEADVNEFIRKYDRGNKGKINLEELTAMLDSVHRKTSRASMSR
ncbi:Calcium-binding protein [Echinococcus granulosus]|uniref:Calcium-binding protein n=1 Tax=Echinococcus granulosus TaxID=6210 RepID=W6UZ37_ECHGR|nr:Calcium-binding protein [Echinococcus granulosus]EUB63932.1 Calcium-binding protein [Echinococcus granulosus]